MTKITPAFLVAEASVRQLHARYADALWRKDAGAFGDCFTRDCEWRTSGTVVHGRGAVEDMFKSSLAKFKRILLTLRTPIIALEADGSVASRAYLTEQSVYLDGRVVTPIGTYYERIVDEGDRWRIKWRLSQAHYAGPPDLSGPLFDNPDWGAPPAMPPADAIPANYAGILDDPSK